MSDYASQPAAQYLSSEHVIEEFYHHGLERLENTTASDSTCSLPLGACRTDRTHLSGARSHLP